MQIRDHGIEVKTSEFLCVIERFAHRIGPRAMLMKDRKIQQVGPPVVVVCARTLPATGHLLSVAMVLSSDLTGAGRSTA